jgi:hypothetical protein
MEKRAREIMRKAEEAAKELSRPKPLLSELFGEVGRVEMFGRSASGERFIAELGPPTHLTVQTLHKEPNPNRELLWETRTWDNWSIQLVYYRDTGKAYFFLNHGPHYTAKLIGEDDLKTLRAALTKAQRRIRSEKETCATPLSSKEAETAVFNFESRPHSERRLKLACAT